MFVAVIIGNPNHMSRKTRAYIAVLFIVDGHQTENKSSVQCLRVLTFLTEHVIIEDIPERKPVTLKI